MGRWMGVEVRMHAFFPLLGLVCLGLSATEGIGRGIGLFLVMTAAVVVRETARQLGDVNPELVQLLEHIVVSHLNLPEWGSPRLPLIPESLIVHHADDLDAKLEMYVRCLSRDRASGPFTDRDPVLGRQLYKGRSV